MKIRTDFVTNSSSSSFCRILVKSKTEEIIYEDDESNLNPGSKRPSKETLNFDKIENGNDLIDLLDKVFHGQLNGCVDYDTEIKTFVDKVSKIKDKKELCKIEISSKEDLWGEFGYVDSNDNCHNYFKDLNISYDFKKNKLHCDYYDESEEFDEMYE